MIHKHILLKKYIHKSSNYINFKLNIRKNQLNYLHLSWYPYYRSYKCDLFKNYVLLNEIPMLKTKKDVIYYLYMTSFFILFQYVL